MSDTPATPDGAPAPATIIDPAAAAASPAPAPAAAATPADPAVAPAPAAAADPAGADWRAKIAGDDKDFLKVLSRYSDEATFGKAHRALLSRMSSGELKKAFPAEGSDEEKATWRKENGIPDKPDEYVSGLQLPEGLVLGEADKPIVAEFASAALASNVDPKAFSGLVSTYYKIQDAQRIAQEDADAEYKKTSDDQLRNDWQGADYRRNLTGINNMIAGWPEGLASEMLASRTPDGRKLGDNPGFIKQLAALALELNPAATLVPAGTTDAVKTVEAELEGIREMRRNDPAKYDADKKLQAREIELLDAQSKMKARAA